MNEKNTESKLREHYQSKNLAKQKVEAILRDVQAARATTRWRRLAVAAIVSFLLVGAVAVWQAIQGSSIAQQDAAPTRFRFVAIRSHGDGCPHCRATSEMYADLAKQFGHLAVDFEQLEFQKQDESGNIMKRATELELTPLVVDMDETAFGLLLSPDGSQVRFQPGDDQAMNRQRFLELIHR